MPGIMHATGPRSDPPFPSSLTSLPTLKGECGGGGGQNRAVGTLTHLSLSSLSLAELPMLVKSL